MRDHPVRAELGDGHVGVAEVDRDHRQAGGARGLDVGRRIADHDGAGADAARRGDRPDERLRIGLADPERVLAADEGEAVGDAELRHQQPGRGLHLVGADRLPPAGAREGGERRRDAGIQPRLVGDMGVVVGEEIAEQRLERHRREFPAGGGEAALDQRAAAGAEQGPGVGDRQGREALADQHEVQRAHQVARRVGERAVEIVDDGRGGHPRQFQKSGSAALSRPPMRTGAMALASPLGPISTATPQSVAGPSAGSKRPEGMRRVKRRSGSSFSMPITES